MKVTFFSNYFNIHQLPLAREFDSMADVEYTFVSLLKTEGVTGRSSFDYDYSFVLREYEDEKAADNAMRHVIEDDIVVFGDMAGKEQYVKARARTGKLFFRYSERLLKRGDWWRYAPPKIYRTWNRFIQYKYSNMFVLCASAYTANDLVKFDFPVEKCLKWGYFPEVDLYGGTKKTLQGYKSLCSAQRLIALKRVDLQVKLASRLKHEGFKFMLKIAGDGPEREKLERLTRELDVEDCVKFLGELSHEETINLMRDNEIFLATSNRKEGWGATINEAMASGCCVVSSEAMGSVPFLVNNGLNGLSFNDGDEESLWESAEAAFRCEALVKKCSEEARLSIAKIWNAKVAAQRLLDFYVAVYLDGSLKSWSTHISEGPMSLAHIS